jgi:hypothetical protein
MSQIVWGALIYLREEYTANDDIGLVTYAGNSFFMWLENDVIDDLPSWISGMIAEPGITEIKESADFSRCGDAMQIDPVEFYMRNHDRLIPIMEAYGINLNGLRCDIYEHIYDYDSNTTESFVKFRGFVNIDRWKENVGKIIVEPCYYNRISSITKTINTTDYPNATDELIGDIVPATFGKFNQDNHYAKFKRVADKQVDVRIGTTVYFNQSEDDINATFSSDATYFPIVGDDGETDSLMYRVAFGAGGLWFYGEEVQGAGQFNIYYIRVDGVDYLVSDMYVQVVEGTGEGSFRKIESMIIDLDEGNRNNVEITIAEIFEEKLAWNITATADKQTWIKIIWVAREYHGDFWQCKSYLDTAGNEISSGLNLLAYSEPKSGNVVAEKIGGVTVETGAKSNIPRMPMTFVRLPSYAYFDSDSGYGENCKLKIEVSLFKNNIDSMSSFLILPATNITPTNDSTENFQAKWGWILNRRQEGLYITPGGTSIMFTEGDVGCLSDTDGNNYYDIDIYVESSPITTAICFDVIPPTIPQYFEFDNVYIGTHFHTGITAEWYFAIASRRFIGAAFQDVEIGYLNQGTNIPDFYYKTNVPSTKNLHFYKQHLPTGGEPYFSGYKTGILEKYKDSQTFKNVDSMLFYIYGNWDSVVGSPSWINIYKLVFMFEKIISIENNVYTPFIGRIFDGTWGERKTAENVMESPVDILEHVCRLQNWTETDDVDTVCGKAYSPDALIKTGTDIGGFDSPRLSAAAGMTLAFQILEEDKSYTDIIKRDLCRTAWLCSYVDEEGRECVDYLPRVAGSTPSEIVTLLDTPIDMEVGDVIEPEESNIFSTPYVRYRYNPASEKFDGLIKVTNAHKPTYSASYVSGFTDDDDGRRVWQACHDRIWAKSRAINQPPGDMTDQYMISTEADAIFFLENWISWQTQKRIEWPVYYVKARSWHIGRHIYINHPHKTGGANAECVIESITKNKNAGYCSLGLIILGSGPSNPSHSPSASGSSSASHSPSGSASTSPS